MMNLLHILAADQGTFFLPPSASNLAKDVDWAWNVILYTTTFFFLVVIGAMTFFIIRYRRRTANDLTSTITHNTPLEIIWTVIPLIIVIMFFFVGFKGFINYDNPASNSTVIDVEARKWNFLFTYPNGGTSDQLFVVKDKPFELKLHSIDVLHALYIPAFRTQRNLIPFRQTAIWFIPEEYSPAPNPARNDPGGFPIFCTQYCGEGHSQMHTLVHVLDQAAYDEKLKELANPFVRKVGDHKEYVPYRELGAKLYQQLGCMTCHTTDGKASTGPTWKGLYKSDVGFAASDVPGFTLSKSDPDEKWEAYLGESMIAPAAKVVANFSPMPTSFAAQLDGTPSNIEKRRALIEYIKSLGSDYKGPIVDPEKDKDLFDADKHPEHPESLAAIKARATQPAR